MRKETPNGNKTKLLFMLTIDYYYRNIYTV